jgi:TolB-like protein
VQLVIIVVALGFPVALILAWVYDFTRHGIKRTSDLDGAKAGRRIEVVEPTAVSARTTPSERSIAVLPFQDLSAGRDHDYFSDGIAEEILSALAKTKGLRVAARRSSFWFKGREAELGEIAQKLNAEHVLEGSVRRDGNRVRITAELIDVGDGFTVWSETFDREMQGIFAVQDEITRSIVEALKLTLDISASPASRSPDAYDVYLQGLFYSDKSAEEALQRSLEFFGRALEKDPQLSRAWTGIAKAWLWLADAYMPPREAYPKVREAATNALKIDHDDAEAHVYLGEAKRILDWDMDGAAQEFSRAVEIDPKSTPSNYFSAAFWAARGQRDEALAYLQRTSKIDPASLWVNIPRASSTVTLVCMMKRSRRANGLCNLIRHSFMASRCWRHCIARRDASTTRSDFMKRRRVSAADQHLVWLSPTRGWTGLMKRCELSTQPRRIDATPLVTPSRMCISHWEGATMRFVSLNARARRGLHHCILSVSRRSSLRCVRTKGSCRF